MIGDAAEVIGETNASITVDNAPKTVMDEDDTFVDDFNHDLPNL